MSDSFNGFGASVDPVQGFRAAPAQQSTPQDSPVQDPRVVFEESSAEDDLAKFQEAMELQDRASRTKFATGNPEKDLYLYLRFKSLADGLTDMIDG